MARRKAEDAVDWDAIERAYRLGTKSNTQLSNEFGVSISSIGRRAKARGWVVDKKEEVDAVTSALLIQAASGNANPNASPSALEIKAAAQANADVVLGHRVGLQRLRIVKEKLLAHVESVVDNLSDMGEVITLLRQESAEGVDKAGDKMAKAMDRSVLIEDVKKLAEIDERVRKGEREAFGIGSEADNTKSAVDDVLRRIMGHGG